MYDCLIIGAGPAGLTASIYAARAGLKVLVFEELVQGGQVATTPEVDNYPGIKHMSGVEFAMSIYEQAVELGVEVVYEKIIEADLKGEVKKLKTSSKEYEGRAVIIANGAKRRKIGCKGEEEFTGSGVSYCATCDGAFYKNKVTAVVGGGNTALEDAVYLANLCKEVHLIHRRDEFRGSPILADALKAKENIIIHYNCTTEEIKGNMKVNSVVIKNKLTGETEEIQIDGIFGAVGLAPENDIFDGQIDLDANGYIVSDESCHTNLKGVYAAGDTRTKKLRQIVTAASDGAMAASEMYAEILSEK